MPCASEEIIMAKIGRQTSEHNFYDVNSYPMAGILLKVINSLIHGSQHSLHPKKYKKQKPRNRIKLKMESNRKFKAQTGQKTEKSR